MATATNGELLRLSGERNPYPGKLGVVEEGALADLIVVDGDPLANLELVADPAKNFVVIEHNQKLIQVSKHDKAGPTKPSRLDEGSAKLRGGFFLLCPKLCPDPQNGGRCG